MRELRLAAAFALVALLAPRPVLARPYPVNACVAAKQDFAAMRSLLRRNLLVFTGVFAAALLILSAVLPEVLAVLVGTRLSAPERATIYGVFLALIPFYVIVSLESSWVTLAIVMKQALRVAVIGTIFIAIFWTTSVWLRSILGVYAVPAAMALAQLNNLAWYCANGRRVLRGGVPRPYSGTAGAA